MAGEDLGPPSLRGMTGAEVMGRDGRSCHMRKEGICVPTDSAEMADRAMCGRKGFVCVRTRIPCFFDGTLRKMEFVMVLGGPRDVWVRNGGVGVARRLTLARFWQMPWLVR